ncbi:MAG: hypothetical protein J5483_02455 [Lachnospiraceae bacterium]|nr:hypothetical protein [Lachnospiraceae bacterium]
MKKQRRRNRRIRIILAAVAAVIAVSIILPTSAYATNPGIDTASYPWEALFADESGEVECHYFTGPISFQEKYVVTRDDGRVELLTGETVSENYTLTYWLHVPYQYDPAKTYPVLSIFPGIGALYLSQNIVFGSAINQNDLLRPDQYTYMLRRYGYTSGTLYLTSDWNAFSAINAKTRDENGKVLDYYPATGAIWNAVGEGYDTQFLQNWMYDIQSDPSYDCFVLFIQPDGALQFEDEGVYPVVLYQDEQGTQHASNYKYETEGAGDHTVVYAEALCAANCEKIGAGWWLDESLYNTTYFASVLGTCAMEQAFTQLLDEMEQTYSIDTDREYLIGDSIGGFFVFDLISHFPDRFAAVVTAAATDADISYANVSRLGNIHILAFHDTFDAGYSIQFSRLFTEKINAVRKNGETGSAQFVEVVTNHSGVTQMAFNGENYKRTLHFLFDHRRERKEETEPEEPSPSYESPFEILQQNIYFTPEK